MRSLRRALSILPLVVALGMVASASAAVPQVIVDEPFTGASAAGPPTFQSFSRMPCLTAGSDPSATPPGCALAAPDPPGAGALRIVDKSGSPNATLMLVDRPVVLDSGLQASFDFFLYDSAADGMTFSLFDAEERDVRPGASGGGLGYTEAPGGYVGVGLDVWGSFIVERRAGCATGGSSQSRQLAIRGPENAPASEYCALGSIPVPGLDVPGATVRTAPGVRHRAEIAIDPAGVADRKLRVTVSPSLLGGLPVTLTVPLPMPAPERVTFGFSGAVGGSTMLADVQNLRVVEVDPRSALTATKQAPEAPIPVGEPVNFLLGVENAGPSDAQNVVLTDTIPAGFKVTEAEPGQGRCDPPAAGLLRCELGTIAAGGGALVAVAGVAAEEGQLTDLLTVTSATPGLDGMPSQARAEATVTIAPAPVGGRIEVVKTVEPDIAYVGEPLVYTIQISNTGDAATGEIVLADVFSDNVEIVESSVPEGTCTSQPPIVCRIAPLDPGEQRVATVTVLPLRAGPLRNTAGAIDRTRAISPAPGPPDRDLPNLNRRTTVVRLARARPVLQLTPARAVRHAGATITHRLRVSTRRADAGATRVCARPGAGLRIVRAPGARVANGRACWQLERLERARPATFAFTSLVQPQFQGRRTTVRATATVERGGSAAAVGVVRVRSKTRACAAGRPLAHMAC